MHHAIDAYLADTAHLLAALDRAALAAAADHLLACHRRRARVWTAGNGGSAATAQHIACDLGKFVIPAGGRPFDACCLTDNISLYSAWANDAEREAVFANLLRGRIGAGDVLVIASVHGGTGFSRDLVLAESAARAAGAVTIVLVGHDGGPLHRTATVSLRVPSTSTPQVEGMHLVIHHLLMQLVKDALAAEAA